MYMDMSFFAAAPVLWAVAMIEYIFLCRASSPRRLLAAAAGYAVTALAALMPMALAGHAPERTPLVFAAVVAFLYQLVCPLLTCVSARRRGGELRGAADPAVGMCCFGAFTAMLLLGGPVAWPIGLIELGMMAAVIVQVAYYIMYGSAMDAYGFRLMTQTNTNEVIEFLRYYPWWVATSLGAIVLALLCAGVWINLPVVPLHDGFEAVALMLAGALCVLIAVAGGRSSLLARSGFAGFYYAKLDNTRRLQAYAGRRASRRAGINARVLGAPYNGPSTIILVVGESANRDYMSAFVPELERDTTPWLSAGVRDDSRHWTIFPHAYSCAMHTFVALEQGFTQKNQFDDVEFTVASSFVDIAKAVGRRVHWYSNQGRLGASMSQVSVVAEEADEALWTDQRPGLPPYDEELLPFLDRVDPTKDNLVVLHLKGNHFSFDNRYPACAAAWKPEGPDDARTTYMNSVRYVDDFLHRVWQIGRDRLNLKAMVYCSDHAIIPDRHRGPTFGGYGDVRIPLAVWTSEDFISAHPKRYEALKANSGRYWTNDFLYELMCGLMDVSSPRFRTCNSLAHDTYAYTREQLTLLDGTVRVADDDERPGSLKK